MTRWLILVAGLTSLVSATPVARAAAQDPVAIVDHVDRLLRGASSRGTVRMEIATRQWSRALDLEIWSLGKDYALVRVASPAREAGTATLMVDDQVWNYLPRVDRTIKIPASLMQGAWMGSHFTNDDLVKESRLIEDYRIAAGGSNPRGGEAWDFTLTPKPDAPVVWGRIELLVRRADSMPISAEYFDDRGRLARTLRYGEYRRFGGRLVPARLEITPADKPDEHTIVTYRSLAFDVGLDPSFFSLRNLRRAR